MKNLEFGPLISVIIPTRHRNDLLAKCLNCLAPGTQTLSPQEYEVIVSDDGSTSTSAVMLRQQFPWARWVEGPKRGPAANRNEGTRHARGEWLAFTDDDCLPKIEWLSTLKAAIVPDVPVYEGLTTCEAGIKTPLDTAPINPIGGCLWSCNMMVQRETFQQLQGFDENFPHPADEDVDFRERALRAGHKINFIADAVIDHPPRKLYWGRKSGAMWESKVRLWHKFGRGRDAGHYAIYEPVHRRFLMHVLKSRVRHLVSFPLSRDSARATLGVVVELWWIAGHLSAWRRPYQNPQTSRSHGKRPA